MSDQLLMIYELCARDLPTSISDCIKFHNNSQEGYATNNQ